MSEIISSETPYRNKFAISQSSIKDWKKMTPMKWYKTWVTKEIERAESSATTIGSFLDCLIFTPKDIDKRFVVSEVNLPSEKVQKILDDIFKHFNELNEHAKLLNKENPGKDQMNLKEPTLEDKDLVISKCVENDHYKNKPDQAYNDVLKKGAEYFEFLKTTKGRKVISPADNIIAIALKKILYEDKVSKPFFVPKKDCEVIFQVRIFAEFELEGYDNLDFLPTKGALDIVHFNHKRKEVREVDLKYTESPYPDFYDIIRKFDYPSQHSFYDYLIREWLKTYKNGEYKDYAVMPPLNVVIDPIDRIPYLYMYNPDDLYIKRKGIEGTIIKGWEDIINEIAWHFDTGDWTRPREHQMNGFLSVKTFNKR